MSYKVYADGKLFYAPGDDDSTTLIAPTLTREVNAAGSFEATVPPCNALVNSLSKLKTTIEVQQDGETIWRGRVLEDEKDFYNRRKIYCAGELSYLSDSVIPTFFHAKTYVYSKFAYENTTISAFLAGCLAVHNALTDSEKHFQLGNVTVTGSSEKITFGDGNTYGTTWDVINNQLIDTYGGYLVVRYEDGTRYLDYLADLTDTSAQTIEFGENLLDFVDNTTAADTYTRLIPLGDYTEWAGESTNRRLTIALVDKEDKPKEQLYVRDEAAEKLFGVITHVELFDGVTDHNELYTKAKALLAENIYLSATYTVSAVDLKDTGADVERIKFGSKVRVISKPHNVDMEVLCTALTEPLAQPEKKTYTLGKTVKTMTDRSVAVHKESSTTVNATTAAQVAANAAQIAADGAAQIADNKITAEQVVPSIGDGTLLFRHLSSGAVFELLLDSSDFISNGVGSFTMKGDPTEYDCYIVEYANSDESYHGYSFIGPSYVQPYSNSYTNTIFHVDSYGITGRYCKFTENGISFSTGWQIKWPIVGSTFPSTFTPSWTYSEGTTYAIPLRLFGLKLGKES